MERAVYEEHAELERDHWWFVGRRAIIERLLSKHLGPSTDRDILDVGCGTGGMLPLLSRFGRVEGLEPEAFAVEHARSAGFEVKHGSIPDDIPAGASYDVVTAFDVIEHIIDDRAAIAAMHAALAPGGLTVVTVPAIGWLWSDHDVVNGHQRRYSRRVLVDVLAAGGFNVLHVSSFNTWLLPGVAAARLVQRFRRPRAAPTSDFVMPSPSVNTILTKVLSSERRLVSTVGLPLGVSIAAIASARR